MGYFLKIFVLSQLKNELFLFESEIHRMIN